MAAGEDSTTTPTKIISRLKLPDNTNETICILCGNADIKVNFRRRLYLSLQKTNACANLELLLGHDVDSETITNIICRNCNAKNANLG